MISEIKNEPGGFDSHALPPHILVIRSVIWFGVTSGGGVTGMKVADTMQETMDLLNIENENENKSHIRPHETKNNGEQG